MVSLVGGLLLHRQTGIVPQKKKKGGLEQRRRDKNYFRVISSPCIPNTIDWNVLRSDEM